MNCNTTHYRANSSSVPGDPTGREKVHHGGGHRTSHAEIEDRQVLGGGGLHGLVAADDIDPEPLGKQLDVLDEIAQQDELTEFLECTPGVSRQPISHDLGFVLHDSGTRGIEARDNSVKDWAGASLDETGRSGQRGYGKG